MHKRKKTWKKKKVFKDEKLEKVSGSSDTPGFDENSIESNDGIYGGIIFNSMSNSDSTLFAVGSASDEYARHDELIK